MIQTNPYGPLNLEEGFLEEGLGGFRRSSVFIKRGDDHAFSMLCRAESLITSLA